MLEVYYTYIGELKEAIDGYCFAKMQTFCLTEILMAVFILYWTIQQII